MTNPVRPALWACGDVRYATALIVDALGSGLLRPFLLLYGIEVLHLSAAGAGLGLSAGMLAGLGAVPFFGRWIDRGARTVAVAATLLVRVAGVIVLLTTSGPPGFTAAVVLLGVGSQTWPAAHAAVVAALTEGQARDAALAAGRSLRNAGLGAGALLATVVVADGTGALRALAAVTALGCLVAALLVGSMRVSGDPVATPRTATDTGDDGLGRITLLSVANLPYAFCFDVLEVALPALLVTRLNVSPSWSAGVFVGNTVLVILAQVMVVRWLARWSRRSALAGSGVVLAVSYLGFWAGGSLGGPAGAAAVAAVSVLYGLGEILYTGSGTALVIATAPPHLLGRALARWQLSTGAGRCAAPVVLTTLLAAGPGPLWCLLAAATLSGAAVIATSRR